MFLAAVFEIVDVRIIAIVEETIIVINEIIKKFSGIDICEIVAAAPVLVLFIR